MPRIEVQCELKKRRDGSVEMIITSEAVEGGVAKFSFADLRVIPGFLKVLLIGIEKIVENTGFEDECVVSEISNGELTVEHEDPSVKDRRPWYKRFFYN